MVSLNSGPGARRYRQGILLHEDRQKNHHAAHVCQKDERNAEKGARYCPSTAKGGIGIMNRNAPAKTHRQMIAEWKEDLEFKAAYDELEMEFTLLRELLLARQRAGLTQAEVAEKMGTKPPAVTRLETALSDNRHSPTISTLKKYAQAVGCKLEVHLVPCKSS